MKSQPQNPEFYGKSASNPEFMKSQSKNPGFRINPEEFAPMGHKNVSKNLCDLVLRSY